MVSCCLHHTFEFRAFILSGRLLPKFTELSSHYLSRERWILSQEHLCDNECNTFACNLNSVCQFKFSAKQYCILEFKNKQREREREMVGSREVERKVIEKGVSGDDKNGKRVREKEKRKRGERVGDRRGKREEDSGIELEGEEEWKAVERETIGLGSEGEGRKLVGDRVRGREGGKGMEKESKGTRR